MKKTLCAGAVALAAIGLFSNMPALSAAELSYSGMEQPGLLAEINIGRIRNVLQLKPEQVAYRPPVEAVLRDLARQQAHNQPDGFVRRISLTAVSIVLYQRRGGAAGAGGAAAHRRSQRRPEARGQWPGAGNGARPGPRRPELSVRHFSLSAYFFALRWARAMLAVGPLAGKPV